MRIDYNELEREKKLRIEAQLALLQEQANRLVAERQALFASILKGANAEDAVFYDDHVDVEEQG